MRIYDGAPRQDFEEVLRSIGAFIDQRGMRDVLLLEAPDGFIVQGLVTTGAAGGAWSESMGIETKETLTFLDEDIARFMDESLGRRGRVGPEGTPGAGGKYEQAFRVVGHYLDERHPNDIFFFEQGGAFVLRLLIAGQAGRHHELIEFTPDDVDRLVATAPTLRGTGSVKPSLAPASGAAPEQA